ncbi:MAG: type VII secretion protein EccE, partial [Actinobacteria bacterium]|nr:type VII secretion protein EccE [Actinomycetota bacterium]
VTRWAAGADPFALLDACAAVPALAVVSSLSLSPTRLGVPGVAATVRVAVREADRAVTDDAVRRAAAAAGGRVERLDGEHLPAVLATLPVGGVR